MAQDTCTQPPTGLVNWWAGDGDAKDRIGHVDGQGGAFAKAEVGQGFSFNGATSVTFGSGVGNFGTSDFTLDFWIATPSGQLQAVIEKRVGCGPESFWGIRSGVRSPGTLFFELLQDATRTNEIQINSTRTVNDGQFHNVALVRQGVNVQIYIDGTLDIQGTTPQPVNLVNGASLTAGTSVCVGQGPTQLFTGELDEIAIFNRALGANDVKSIFQAGTAGMCKDCQVEVPPPFGLDSQLPWSQGNPLWASEEYDDVVPNTTIGQEGCALTALALEVQAAGVFTTPLFLNDDLRMFNGYGPNGKIDWGLATRAVNQRGFNLKWKNVAKQDLDDALCIGKHPVIAAVRGSHGTPSGHFVIITGKQGDTYTIIDPGCSVCATLASTNTCSTTTGGTLCNYGNQFDTRGFVVDPAGNISELDFSLGDVADFLITDPIGRSTGLDPSKGNVQVIPASAHYVDSLDNDLTGEADLKPDHFVNIFQPQSGNYSVFVSGAKLGEYILGINAFSEDGTRQPSLSASGIANLGSSSRYQVQFSSSGALPNITRVATFQSTLDDINNSLQLGLIDNSGIANSLSNKIQHASNTVEPERTNTMNAFVNEVNAQSGKHITGIAVQVLLDDADSLLRQATQ